VVGRIGERANPNQIITLEQLDRVGRGETLSSSDLVGDGVEGSIADQMAHRYGS
jgi:hypothetical protein